MQMKKNCPSPAAKEMVDKRPTERWSFFKNSCPVVGSTSAVVSHGEMSSTWSDGQDAKEVFRGHWFRDLK